ncbi:MAG TPA: protein BatD, partial [Rudaea sp.]
TSARVGEPITLTLREKAQGQGFEQLPELKLPKIEGADVYPDKEVTHNRDDGAWLFGERERKFAIVPNRAGKLELPAIGLAWWDVVHDRAASADVPAVTLDVAPSAASADTKTAPASPASAAPPAPVSTVRYEASDSAELHFWRVLAFTALLLWAATLLGVIAWVRSDRRRTERSAAIAEPRRRATNAASAFDRACAHADLAEAARALVAWAQDERPSIRHLGELAQAVSDAAQKQLIGELMRALYGARSDGASSVDLAARLRSAFRRGPVFADPAPARAPASALPPLYPFRT